MTVATIKQNLFSPSEEMQMKYTLWMNRLLVIYAFLLPISNHAKAQVQFAILILFILRGNFKEYLSEPIKNPIVIAFILYFFVYILWLIGTENFDYAKILISQNKYSFLPILFLSFLDKRFILPILSGFIAGIFFSEIISYMISFDILPWRLDLFGKELYQAFSPTDPSPFMHHSKYGLALALASVFLLHNILTQSLSLTQKIISIFFISTITLNISITGGRIGYLLYFVLMLSLMILHFRKKALKPIISIIILVSIVASIAYSFSPIFKQKINYTMKTIEELRVNPLESNTSFGKRVTTWYYSMKVIKENPILGVGTGDYYKEVSSYISNNNIKFKPLKHPHNQYISILIQFGLIGLFIFLNIFYQVFKYKYPTPYQNTIAIIINISILLAFVTEADLVKFYLPLWILFLSIALTNKTYKISYSTINKEKKLIYPSIAIIALIIGFFV